MSEVMKDRNKICESYIGIGVIFYEQNKFQQTITYMNKALASIDERNSKENIFNIYNNLAIAYIGLNDQKRALEYQFMALKIAEEVNNPSEMDMSYSNIGSAYHDLHKINEALTYYLKSIKIGEEINDGIGLTFSYNGAGNCYQERKNYGPAQEYYIKALNTSQKLNFKVGEREAYMNLASISEISKNYEKALQYHKLYAGVKDSILNEESLKQTSELNVRYETDKKEKEILLLTKDQEIKDKNLKEQRLVRMGLIIGLGLFLALSFLLYNLYRIKQKANFVLEKQEIHQKNIFITDSIDYAKTIQEAILPDDEKLTALFPDHFILYKPKAIVSGDFYWTGKKGEQIICVVADCTGHGVPGAFMSLLGHNMLENVIQQESAVNPGAILSALNQEIVARFSKKHEPAKHGMDIAVISFDPAKQLLQYAGARNSVYLVRHNSLIELKADKCSTGVIKKDNTSFAYANQTYSLQKEDMIYLFSDGFPDQKGGPEHKKFFYQPFKDLLTSISQHPVDKQKKLLDEAINNWMGGGEQIDDMLVMGIRWVTMNSPRKSRGDPF